MTNIELWTTFSATDTNAPARSGVAVSSTNTYYSNVIHMRNATTLAFTMKFTGTPTGTFTLWRTDKRNPNLASDADWVQDAGYTAVNPAGAAGGDAQTLTGRSNMKYRFKYVNASGAGTITGDATVAKSA